MSKAKALRMTVDGQPKPHIKLAPGHWPGLWHAQVGIHNAVGDTPFKAYFNLMAFIRGK